MIKPATLEQRTPEPVLSFSRVHTCPKKPFRLVISSMAVVPGPYTDVAGSQRHLQETRQVASFTRIQLMRAGIDLMNRPTTILTSRQRAGMKVVADNSGFGATTSTRIEDSGRNPQIIPGQKSAYGKRIRLTFHQSDLPIITGLSRFSMRRVCLLLWLKDHSNLSLAANCIPCSLQSLPPVKSLCAANLQLETLLVSSRQRLPTVRQWLPL